MERFVDKDLYSDDIIEQLIDLSTNNPESILGPKSDIIFSKCIDVLNSNVNEKTKTRSLYALTKFAQFPKCRDSLLSHLHKIDQLFENEMKLSETSKKTNNYLRLMFILLVRILDYKFTGQELLEMTDNNTLLSFDLIAEVLLSEPFELNLLFNTFQILYDLVRVDTYIKSDSPVELLVMIIKYSDLMGRIQKKFFSGDFIDTCCNIINERLFLTSDRDFKYRQHLTIVYFVSTINYLYSVNPGESSDIRQFLVTKTKIINTLLIPYITHCVNYSPALSNLDAAASFTEDPILMQGLVLSLKLLCISTFIVPLQFRKKLIESNFTCSILKVTKFFKTHGGVLSLIFFYNGNIDSLNPPNSDSLPEYALPHNILAAFNDILDLLDINEISYVIKLIEKSGEIPVSRDTITYSLLWRLLDEKINANKKDDEEEDDDLDDLSSSEFQRQAKELKENNMRAVAEAKSARSHSLISNDSKYESKANKSQSKEVFRLLGDLPSLSEKPRTILQLPPEKSDKSKKSRRKNPKSDTIRPSAPDLLVSRDDDTPKEFLCSINGHIMKQPMRSPTGYVFEHDTIRQWIQTKGNFCPITGKALKMEDLVLDKVLTEKITKWQIEKMMKNTKLTPNNEIDLYDF